MTPQMIGGFFLVALGAVILLGGFTEAAIDARRAIPLWIGGTAIVAGILLVGVGMRRRSYGA